MESVGWVLPKSAKKVENLLWRHRGIPQKRSIKILEKVVTKKLITHSNFGLCTWNFFYKLSRCMGRLNRKPIFEFLCRGHFMGVQSRNTPNFEFDSFYCRHFSSNFVHRYIHLFTLLCVIEWGVDHNSIIPMFGVTSQYVKAVIFWKTDFS